MTVHLNGVEQDNSFNALTRLLAGFCHKCNICPSAEQKPESAFGRLMRWHRQWCPAWAAHTQIYGEKNLRRDIP